MLPAMRSNTGPTSAANAALFAVALLALHDAALSARLAAFRAAQTEAARAMVVPPPQHAPALQA